MPKSIYLHEYRAKKAAKNNFFKLMNHSVFSKTMENVQKHWEIKFVTTERRRNFLVSGPNHHSANVFTENLLVIEIIKTQLLVNKLIYLGLSMLDQSKNAMYMFWHDYVKLKYRKKARLCCMDTYIVSLCTQEQKDIYKDIKEDLETRFETSNCKIDRPLPKGKNKKVIDLMKDELGGKVMKEFAGLRAKTYRYLLIDDGSDDKKAMGAKKCVIKKRT